MDNELDCDQHLLFERLVKKVERVLEAIYIKEGTFPNGQYYQTMRGDLLVGRIESSENSWDIPVLVIDDKAFSWDEVGKILMSNEGFLFSNGCF